MRRRKLSQSAVGWVHPRSNAMDESSRRPMIVVLENPHRWRTEEIGTKKPLRTTTSVLTIIILARSALSRRVENTRIYILYLREMRDGMLSTRINQPRRILQLMMIDVFFNVVYS